MTTAQGGLKSNIKKWSANASEIILDRMCCCSQSYLDAQLCCESQSEVAYIKNRSTTLPKEWFSDDEVSDDLQYGMSEAPSFEETLATVSMKTTTSYDTLDSFDDENRTYQDEKLVFGKVDMKDNLSFQGTCCKNNREFGRKQNRFPGGFLGLKAITPPQSCPRLSNGVSMGATNSDSVITRRQYMHRNKKSTTLQSIFSPGYHRTALKQIQKDDSENRGPTDQNFLSKKHHY